MICDICGKELEKVTECAWTSCPLLYDLQKVIQDRFFEELANKTVQDLYDKWNEERIDVIGTNGNDGLHYTELKGFRNEI